MSLPATRIIRTAAVVFGVAGGLALTGASAGAVIDPGIDPGGGPSPVESGVPSCGRGEICMYSGPGKVQMGVFPGQTYTIGVSGVTKMTNHSGYLVCAYKPSKRLAAEVHAGKTIILPRSAQIRTLKVLRNSRRCPARSA